MKKSNTLTNTLRLVNLWKKIRNCGTHDDGQMQTSAFQQNKNEFCRYFASVQSCKPVTRIDDCLPESPNAFSFQTFTIESIQNAVSCLSSNSAGTDKFDLKFLKLIMPFIEEYVLHIFNTIISTNSWPDYWKCSLVCPIPKNKNTSKCSDYRPVGLLPILSKLLEILLKWQMTYFFDERNLGSYFQSGFRANHSTTTALILFNDYIRSYLDKGKIAFMLNLDFSKAFDNVDHNNILCEKLKRHYEFSSNSCDLLIHSYLENRRICMKMNGEISEELNIYSGVIQGSVLGPELFKIYISDPPNVVRNAKLHLFADDVRIYLGCEPSDVYNGSLLINEDLERINGWSVKNRLYLNHMKSEAMLFAKNPSIHAKPIFHIDEKVVSYVKNTKNLGVIFNEELSWD